MRGTGNHAPVPHAYVHLLLRPLQNGYTLLWDETPEGMRAILYESFHLVSDEYGFPENRVERLIQDRHEMVTDHLTGQREVWPVVSRH